MKNIKKLTDRKYVNMYSISYKTPNGKTREYDMASRRKEEDLTYVTGHHNKTDAVAIIPQFENGDLVILKQFRPVINDFIYEFPAGLVDPGESEIQAAMRELKEETGLDVKHMSRYLKACYSSCGMTDEAVAIYKATVTGELSLDYKEENENIEIIILKQQDIEKFLEEHIVAVRTALILKHLAK